VGLLAYNLGSFLGPVISGTMMRRVGHDELYIAIGLFALLAFIAAVTDVAWATCCREERGYQGALS
jgi:MFS family permease